MAKAKKLTNVAESDPETSDVEGEEKEDIFESSVQIDILDTTAVKHLVDEYSAKEIKEYGFKEDPTLSNIKIAVSTVATLVALVAQFAPIPFPDNIQLLFLCAVVFFLCSGYLQYLFMFVDGDAILITEDTQRGLRPDQFYPALYVSSAMTRYEPTYDILIKYRDTKKYGTSVYKATFTVSDFFTEDGFFLEEIFADKLLVYLDEFHRGKKNT